MSPYPRYRRALEGEELPCALVDMDALDRNVDRVVAMLAGKRLRLATKSIRCAELIDHVARRTNAIGLMTFAAEETERLLAAGHRDLLLAYPVARRVSADRIARANKAATVSVVVDHVDHLDVLDAAAREAGTVVPVVVEVDVAYRAFGLHLGVRRSPLHEVADVVAFARTIERYAGLRFHGLMAYEAQIAGLGDTGPHLRALKQVSRPHVERVRRELSDALKPELFNGGGTGSLVWCAREDALTEVTAGSAFLGSHLFDRYRDIAPEPAAFFALEVARKPAPGIVTCHGGGYVASGEAGKDRLPMPWLPDGLALLPMEGAGEVQTPLKTTTDVRIGDPVIFRHAKGGELAEHFAEYLLVRGDAVERRAATYRTWTKRG